MTGAQVGETTGTKWRNFLVGYNFHHFQQKKRVWVLLK